MKESILNIETIHECNRCLGCKTLHPLVSVIDLSKTNLEQCTIKFDFYTIIMLEGDVEDFSYGRKSCDYSNASLLFLTPGESINIDHNELLRRKGRLLAFHPDLLSRTSLDWHIEDYTFFFYKPDEALHLSLREKSKIIDCQHNIAEELEHAIDNHSKTLISRHIELLLDYCTRFYERQFITRCEANKSLIRQTNILLDEYIQSGKLKKGISPSAEYCADKLHLSSQYFNDLLYFETVEDIDEYFQLKQLEAAKTMLLEQGCTAGAVAERLGYPNVQQFRRIFKMNTGIAPDDYKLAQN